MGGPDKIVAQMRPWLAVVFFLSEAAGLNAWLGAVVFGLSAVERRVT
jgi:hypothetical protein